MSNNNSLPEGGMQVETTTREFDRLMQEINLLKLEGALFCFDPREAKRRRDVLTFFDARKKPISIELHPKYGQPSVLAFKVLQAIFLKFDEQGCVPSEDGRCLYNDTVSFTQRELAALTDRTWSGRTSKQLFEAVMQLHSTKIIASLKNKDADEWQLASFIVITSALFAGRGNTLTRCAVRIAPEIMAGLNKRYVAFFNLNRLQQLDTLGLVLYKHVFFNLSKRMYQRKRSSAPLSCWKDYATICSEWLGGLKVQRYRADITKQLGRHLDGLIATGLLNRYTIEKNAAGDGFNITFYAGKGFFDDYDAYYVHGRKPRQIAPTASLEGVQALELVQHFHRMLGRTDERVFGDQERAYAEELLGRFTPAEVRDLIAFTVEKGEPDKHPMRIFNVIKVYLDRWAADQTRRKRHVRQLTAMKACTLCNESGMLELKEHGTSRYVAHPCPHQIEQVSKIEERLRAYRV
jgi:hypothetical protein